MDILKSLLDIYWLRPETALWRALDIAAMEDFVVQSPSLDLGCGDGIFSFIRAGGAFNAEFDVFQSLELDGYFSGADVYDSSKSINAPIDIVPEYKIDVGFDHKQNLINKASTLGFYNNFKLGDANKPLPFAGNSFKSIFSNIVYWLDDPQTTLHEIYRILQTRGQACLMLPNITLPGYSFYNQLYLKTGNPDYAFLEKLDRGRFAENIKSARSSDEWEIMFTKAGLKVHSHKQHLSKQVIQMWDIGLRPLFPVLSRMTSLLPENDKSAIKKEWVDIIYQFLMPIYEMDNAQDLKESAAFHCYTLTK